MDWGGEKEFIFLLELSRRARNSIVKVDLSKLVCPLVFFPLNFSERVREKESIHERRRAEMDGKAAGERKREREKERERERERERKSVDRTNRGRRSGFVLLEKQVSLSRAKGKKKGMSERAWRSFSSSMPAPLKLGTERRSEEASTKRKKRNRFLWIGVSTLSLFTKRLLDFLLPKPSLLQPFPPSRASSFPPLSSASSHPTRTDRYDRASRRQSRRGAENSVFSASDTVLNSLERAN